jgi:glycogen operon protein
LRFDRDKVLLDPYGLAVAMPQGYDRPLASQPGDNTAIAPKSVVVDPRDYDWEGDQPLQRPLVKTIVYELHPGGFTKHASSGVAPDKRGTYAGLIEKIPYLVDLGVTAVELMPVFQFDAQDAPPGRVNYWGYAPISFFAPHVAYASCRGPLCALHEFRDMVKALHRAGIEVVLDVVYNHTTEGNETGPTLCFKGFANDVYYILDPETRRYANYSGCGNTLNANQSVVRRLILDSLRYWVQHMHVDGFRFDLASILARDETGNPHANPPVVWDIETDPVLAGTKFFAEAWDAAGLYQVGSFLGDWWQEWNGHFRDDIRSFVKSDPGMTRHVAERLLASPDMYVHENRDVEQSINFITCHDGFTLNDLVSYNEKHNEANGEGNRDGHNDNRSWNCGVEGPTDDPEIERLRNRQVKNFMAINLMALGTPLLLMGDEMRRTQQGNNNAYCQDNAISWLDWSLLERHADIVRFAKEMIRLRQGQERVASEMAMTLAEWLRRATVSWHGIEPNRPDWSDASRIVSCTVKGVSGRRWYHFILNAHWEPHRFRLPAPPVGSPTGWMRLVDTSLDPPNDIVYYDDAKPVRGPKYPLGPRSVAMFMAAVA